MTEVAADDPIQRGLAAWGRGDLDALETILDPAVTLRAVQSGPWDCEDRDQVMRLLRERAAERGEDRAQGVDVRRVDQHTFIVSGLGGGDGVATRVSTEQGKVVAMQQFATTEPDPVAESAVRAVREGDTQTLDRVLADRPDLATARVTGYRGRTLLHIATDWPGHYPNVSATIRVLVDAGAEVDAPSIGKHAETPLHWAASSDDVKALGALLDAGANINAPGAVIGNGTPLNDATAFGQWNAARRLVERGADVSPWDAAALGLTDRLRSEPADNLGELLWAACHGGHRETAAFLLDAGADIDWVGYDELTPLGAAERSGAGKLVTWLRSRGARNYDDLT